MVQSTQEMTQLSYLQISQQLKNSNADIEVSEYTLTTSNHYESPLNFVSKVFDILMLQHYDYIVYIQPPNHRVFVLNMYPSQARAVLCQVKA